MKPASTVKHSALGWLRRLGWQYLSPVDHAAYQSENASGILLPRLRQRLQAIRFAARGQTWALDESGIAQVVAALGRLVQRRGVREGNDALLRLLLDGIDIEQHLPDGQRVHACVHVIDWDHAERNGWDVAECPGGQVARDAVARIEALTGYVNGLPLLGVLCVERDCQWRWGSDAEAIALLQQQRPEPALSSAQMLMALDRRGGRYATHGSPSEHWVHWREQGWAPARLRQLRMAPPTPTEDDRGEALADLRAVHAPLLAGVMAPERVLALLRGFIDVAADGRRRIARSAQFFAVQAALDQMRRIDVQGRRCGGQLSLAPGSGMELTRHWLLHHLRRDPWLRHCRVLRVQSPASLSAAMRDAPSPLSPGRRLAAFLAEGRGTTLHTSVVTLQAWLRRRDTQFAGDDLVLLVDADLQHGHPAWLQRAHERLPRAAWLWLTSTPTPCVGEGGQDAPLLYAYPPAHGVADGVLAPVYQQTLQSSHVAASVHDAQPGSPDTRVAALAAAICQHVADSLLRTERDLQALLLVTSNEDARHYQRAFVREGTLRSALVPATAQYVAGRRHGDPGQIQLLIAAAGVALPSFDARLAVVYLDRELHGTALAGAVALLSRPHHDKRSAWLVNLRASGCPLQGPDAWGPCTLQDLEAALPRHHQRLRALLPAASGSNFHACRTHLAPRWALDTHGEPRDLHRQRRRCLHRRVTTFGQQLQAALLTADDQQDLAEGSQRWRYHYDLHFCSLLRDAVTVDAQEQPLYVAEDVRIRHWARERAPQVQEPAWEYLSLQAVDTADVRHEADALHCRLRVQLDVDTVAPEMRLRTHHQLRALLAQPATPARRLSGLRALQATLDRDASGTEYAASPLLQACHGLLTRHLGAAVGRAQLRLRQALAAQLEAALIDVRVAHAGAPHLIAMALRRRLTHAWPMQLTPQQRDAVLDGLPALLGRAALFEAVPLD
jgi:hypothetical protein